MQDTISKTSVENRAREPNEIGLWRPPSWFNVSARCGWWLMILGGCLGGLALMLRAVHLRLGMSPKDYLLVILLYFIIMWTTSVIHESGHIVTARWASMTVLSIQVGALQGMAMTRGWRFRWHPRGPRSGLSVSGSVLAIPNLDRSLRAQHISYAIGGPFANLIASLSAMLLACLAWSYSRESASELVNALLSFAVYNAAIGAANLLPFACPNPSDGLQLLQWLKSGNRACRVGAYVRFLALSIQGVLEEDLPGDVVTELAVLPPPYSLISIQIRLKTAQHSGRWSEVHELEDELDRMLGNIDRQLVATIEDLISIIRMEIIFTKAMELEDESQLSSSILTAGATWWLPSLWPRCLALRAALSVNAPEC